MQPSAEDLLKIYLGNRSGGRVLADRTKGGTRGYRAMRPAVFDLAFPDCVLYWEGDLTRTVAIASLILI